MLENWQITYTGQRMTRPEGRPSRERLKKSDNRLDHLVSREQFIVVVIGVGKHEKRLRSHRGIVQATSIFDRHDSTAPASDDEQWHSDPLNLIDRGEPVLEKKTHR